MFYSRERIKITYKSKTWVLFGLYCLILINEVKIFIKIISFNRFVIIFLTHGENLLLK